MMRTYESERVALRRIRGHRNRRAAWRHVIRVRRARVRLLGLAGLCFNLFCFAMVGEMSLLLGIVAAVAILSPDHIWRCL